MKKPALIFAILYLFTGGCGSKELAREEAFPLIQQSNRFPKVIDYDIYCSDPQYAKQVIDAGLEDAGLVRVQRTQKLSEVGKPLIEFTEKAQPYLLPTPAADKALNVQKVKIAEEDLVEVTSIRMENDGKAATADYTTSFKKKTPFSALTKINFNEKATRQASFYLSEDGWKLK